MPTPLPFLMFHPHMTSNHLLPHKASNFSYLQYHLLNLFATVSQKSSKFSFLPTLNSHPSTDSPPLPISLIITAPIPHTQLATITQIVSSIFQLS